MSKNFVSSFDFKNADGQPVYILFQYGKRYFLCLINNGPDILVFKTKDHVISHLERNNIKAIDLEKMSDYYMSARELINGSRFMRSGLLKKDNCKSRNLVSSYDFKNAKGQPVYILYQYMKCYYLCLIGEISDRKIFKTKENVISHLEQLNIEAIDLGKMSDYSRSARDFGY